MESKRPKHSNLQSFLTRTMPSVPAYSLQKMEYFTLGDLWSQYAEWSAYGVGVPIIHDNHEKVIQYYVPYLSAIQIYTSKHIPCLRILLEESENESFSDDNESDKVSKSSDALSEDSDISQESSLPTDEIPWQLYLHYIEYESPYRRIPLADKVNELAERFPGLMSFKSIEMSPSSWMSIAWYPIYQIPECRNVKDLSACFLTYYAISTSIPDIVVPRENAKDFSFAMSKTSRWEHNKAKTPIILSPFGLSTFKMQGSLWRNPETSDSETIESLNIAAQSWLKRLSVDHHDFNFFTAH
ncbi:hypothetical protein Cni_G08742 [Canna indica]|uniref:Uncharacterized protein n=1 Tax=Canna indica TaxID=4628 RepID=A0AAQ3Q731_9LILI|nr:hypothetical protein Cni_G08742 [Canna indica]